MSEIDKMKERIVFLREEADFLEEQVKLAQQALSLKGKYEKYYSPQYQVIGAEREGSFVGLACKSCSRWEQYGHDKDCPVLELENQQKD